MGKGDEGMTPEPCRYCTRPAVNGMCTFHILLNSGAPLEYCNEIADSRIFQFSRCPHCNSRVPRTEFCETCYDSPHPAILMDVAEGTHGALCPYCLSPKTWQGRTIQGFTPSDCLVCVRGYKQDGTPAHHTPEQLAAWVRDVQDSQEKSRANVDKSTKCRAPTLFAESEQPIIS